MLRGGTTLEGGVHLYLAAALQHACVKVSSDSCACGRVLVLFFSFFFFFFLVFGFLFRSESVHLNCLLQVFCFLGSTSCWTCSSSSSSSSSCCLDRRLCLLWFRSFSFSFSLGLVLGIALVLIYDENRMGVFIIMISICIMFFIMSRVAPQ